METILVTGGYGLVGHAIQKKALGYPNDKFVYISSKMYDLTDAVQVEAMFEKYRPDHVLHLAAYVGGLYYNIKHSVEMFENNMLMSIHIMRCCYRYKVKRLMSCLSTCIFPEKMTYPLNEEQLHDGKPYCENEAYAYAKRMMESMTRFYNTQYGTKYVCVIPTNIYGEFDNFNRDQGHVIPSLVHKCYMAKKEKQPFVIFGNGSALRQFILSDDLATLMLHVLLQTEETDPLLLTVPKEREVSIRSVATAIAKEFDYSENLVFDEGYSNGQLVKTADNSKLARLCPDFPFVGLEEGIRLTVQWFVDNYEIARK